MSKLSSVYMTLTRLYSLLSNSGSFTLSKGSLPVALDFDMSNLSMIELYVLKPKHRTPY